MFVKLDSFVSKLVTWLSSLRNVGCLKCKVTIGPINISCKDDYSSSRMTKGRVKLFGIQGIDVESWKTVDLTDCPHFYLAPAKHSSWASLGWVECP